MANTRKKKEKMTTVIIETDYPESYKMTSKIDYYMREIEILDNVINKARKYQRNLQ